MLKIKGCGISILNLAVGATSTMSAMQSGQKLEVKGAKFLAGTLLAISFLLMAPAALFVMWYMHTTGPSHSVRESDAASNDDIAQDIEAQLAAPESDVEVGEEALMEPVPPWLEPLHVRPSWVHTRQSKRFMARIVPWNEDFDDAFLGEVTEAEVLATGFGGIVRAGCIDGHQIVSKEMFRDNDNDALFQEVYVGLLVPASPCMGFAQTADGAPRLISARLPENVAEFLARSEWPMCTRMQLAIGMLEAVEHLANLGLVHCDIKPDNFMLDERRNVFIIDFGSVCVEGATPPMTCQLYCPPDQVVTLAWDIFSMGAVFAELFANTPHGLAGLMSGMCSGLISERPSLRECAAILRAEHLKLDL